MRTCTAAEFVRRWPDRLHAIVVPPELALPESSRNLLTQFGLPSKLTIVCYNDTTWTFSGQATPLATIWARGLERGQMLDDIPEGWDRFWHLADEEYCQGGGWVCIEAITGRLVVIDLDAPQEIYLVSSLQARKWASVV